MTAGRIILTFKGQNSDILSSNPSISFWKMCFTRYTNFSMQSIELDCEDKIIPSIDNDTIYRFKIHRYADLINYIYLTIDLPEIFSDTEEFKWVDNLGCAILNYARLYHNSSLIEEIDGKYLYLYNELYNDTNTKKYFNKITGNISELNNPYNDKFYKRYSKSSHISSNNTDNVIYPNKNYNTSPSIDKYQLNIPLLFSCFKNNNNLPLISLSKTEVFIEISIKSIKNLYNIVSKDTINLINPCPSLREYWNYDLKSTKPQRDFDVKKRVIDQGNFSRFTSKFENYNEFNFQTMKPRLNANYIFVDDKERKLFAGLSIENLETFNDHVEFYDLTGLNNLSAELYHPVKNFIILAQRNDVHLRNEWMNFTNLDTINNVPQMLQNQILNYAKNESLNKDDNLFKYLGAFTDIEYSNEQSIISNYLLNTNLYSDNNLIENILVEKSGDYFTKPALIALNGIDNILATGLETNIKYNLQHAIINQPGNYKSVPKYIVTTNNNNSDNIELEMSIKDDKLYKIDILNKGSNYDNILNIELKKTYNVDDIGIITNGNNYTDRPNIFLYPTPKNGYTIDNVLNLNIVDAQFKANIKDNMVNSIDIIDIGNNYNTDILDLKLYIGGNLDNIEPLILDTSVLSNSVFTQIPNIHIHDGYNQIIKPIINTHITGNNELGFNISNLEYNNGGNYGTNGNLGYGLSDKTKISTGLVIDKIYPKIIVDTFLINREFVEPKLKFLPKEYITSSHINNQLVDNIFNFTSIEIPNVLPQFSGDIHGFDCKFNIKFYDNITYNDNILEYDGIYNVYNYPTFDNILLSSNSNNSLIISYDIHNNQNITQTHIPNSIIDNVFDTAIFYINYAESKDIVYNGKSLQIKKEKLIPSETYDNVNSTYTLEMNTGVQFDKLPYKIYKFNENTTSTFEDVTYQFVNSKVMKYNDLLTKKSKNVLLFYRNEGDNHELANDNDIFSLYINDTFIDSIQIINSNSNIHAGLNIEDAIPTKGNSNGVNMGSSPEVYKKQLFLLFGNFEDNIFSIEIGKRIKEIEIVNSGYAYKNIPSIGITNANDINMIDFRTVHKNIPETDIHDRDADIIPILDYGGSNAEVNIEISYGGDLNNIKDFVEFTEIKDGKELNLTFNREYYGDNVYNNIFENIANNAVFNQFCSDNIFLNYKSNPYFIINNDNVNLRDDYEDIVVEGILDYGGSGAKIKIDIDYGGSLGNFEVIKSEQNNTLNINNDIGNIIYFDINLKNMGIGYKSTSNNTSFLIGSLIQYNKFKINDAKIIRQYNLNTVNGLITPFENDNNLYLGSRIAGDSTVYDNVSVKNFKGIALHKDPGFVSYPNGMPNNIDNIHPSNKPFININTDYDRVRLTNYDDFLNLPTNGEKDQLVFLVGGILDESPIIVNKGNGYGSKLDDTNGNNSMIFKNLMDIDKGPHIYSTAINSYNSENIVPFTVIGETSVKTSINSNYEIEECKINIKKYTESINPNLPQNSISINTNVFIVSGDSRHELTNWPPTPTEWDLTFIDSYFYINKSEIYNKFSSQLTNNTIVPSYNVSTGITNTVLDELFIEYTNSSNVIVGSDFNNVIAYTPYWEWQHGNPLKAYDNPRTIDSVELVNDKVKFTLSTPIPSPSDFGINMSGGYPNYYYPLDPNQFDLIPGEYVYFTNEVANINGTNNQSITNIPIFDLIEMSIKIPLFKYNIDNDEFTKLTPVSTFGSQLTSFDIKNQLSVDNISNIQNIISINNSFVSDYDNHVVINTNLINDITIVNEGIGYYKNKSEPLIIDIQNNEHKLYFRGVIDNDAEPASIDVVFNDDIENGKGTISNINISLDSNNDRAVGKDYSTSPDIYFIDHYSNEIYRDVIFANITSVGSLDINFTIDSNIAVPVKAEPYIGGKLTEIQLYNYYKIPCLIKNSELRTFMNQEFYNFYQVDKYTTDINYDKFVPAYYLTNYIIKIGGNITKILIKDGGINYKSRPKIFAAYNDSGKYILDTTFNPDPNPDNKLITSINYDIIEGAIKSLNGTEYIHTPIYIENWNKNLINSINHIEPLILKTANIHNSESVIYNGGVINNIAIINTPNSLQYNFNFTSKSNKSCGLSINNYIIDSIGSEIDDRYEYNLFIEQIQSNKRYYYNYENHKIRLETKGANLPNNKNIKLIPNIINDGAGFGAVADTTIHIGDGGLITSVCGIDKININNIGSGYNLNGDNNYVKILNGSNDIFSKIYKWDSIDNSLIFDSQKFLTYEYLKKFNSNWIFRDYEDIPIINNYDDFKMYDKDIINSIEIILNNQNREYIINGDLYKSLEKIEFWNKSSDNDFYVYSFSLDNNSSNAKGACNFSSFKDIKFKIKLKDMSKYEDYKYNISIYFEYYNVKQYMNGIGAIKFAN